MSHCAELGNTSSWGRLCSCFTAIRRCRWLYPAVFSLLLTSPLFASEEFVLNSGNVEPFISSDGGGFYGLLTREIFRRLDIDAKVIRLPSERALINANKGVEDGNIARIAGLREKYPNLIRVPGKIVDFEFVAYAQDTHFKVKGWNSLKPYEVGFLTGWKYLEKQVVGVKRITRVRTRRQLFNMLVSKKIDVALYDRWGASWWIKKLQLNVHALRPAIATETLYMYLHKKHQALVPQVARVLAEMKKDGSYRRIYDQTLTVLLNP